MILSWVEVTSASQLAREKQLPIGKTHRSEEAGCEHVVLGGDDHDTEATWVRIVEIHKFLVLNRARVRRDPQLLSSVLLHPNQQNVLTQCWEVATPFD